MSWIRTPVTNRQTCPGIQRFLRPTIQYVTCPVCGGAVELWSDEAEGVCIACGATWTKPDATASCLEYCAYADQCRQIIRSREVHQHGGGGWVGRERRLNSRGCPLLHDAMPQARMNTADRHPALDPR